MWVGSSVGQCWLCRCALSPAGPCGRSCPQAPWPGRAGGDSSIHSFLRHGTHGAGGWAKACRPLPGGLAGIRALLWSWVLCRQFSAGPVCQRDVLGLAALQGAHMLPRVLVAPEAVLDIPRECWATELTTAAALRLPRELGGLHPPAPLSLGPLCCRGRFWSSHGCHEAKAGMLLRCGGSGAGRAARAVCRCRLGGRRFPGEGRCAHGWGMWVYAGREGRALPLQRGACSCLPLRAGAAPAAAGLAAAFPEKQSRLGTWLASLPLTWLLRETGRSSPWIHLRDTLLKLLWGAVWAAWGPCSSDSSCRTTASCRD